MAPFGATCVLLFSVPNSPLSQPANVIGGQLGTTYEVGNYPGFQMITGPDLVQQFET